MKLNRISLAHRLVKEECGQTLVFVALTLVAFLGLAGMSMDAGHGFYAYELLKSSTNAAVLAGAAGLPNTTTAANNVATYSSTASDKNAYGILQNVTATPTFLCLNTVTTKLSVPCQTASGGSGGYNSLKVTQTAEVNTWIGQFFGVPVFNISATATAAMSGGQTTPYNVAIIVDTTDSMNGSDSGKNCAGTQITCALQGVQDLLLNMAPCARGVTCSGSGSYVDDVSLYVFPALAAGSSNIAKDTTCPSSRPTIVPYTFNNVTGASPDYTMSSTLGTYQVINYNNDYKASDSATTLAITAGAGACSGISAPGGEGTYYAQVIYVAAANLLTAQGANPGSKMALIILSDGDATACNTATSTGDDCGGKPSQIVATTGALNGTGTTTSNPSHYQDPTYPSALGECGQAVAAAQAASVEGIVVYTIGYGSKNTGCTTDSKYSTAGNSSYGAGTWARGDSPCQAMAAMATSGTQFFSDNGSGNCPAVNSANQAYTSIPSIMQAVFSSFTSARLIPNGTT